MYRILKLRDHNVFQRVDAAARLLDLVRQKVAGLFDLRKLYQKRHQLGEFPHGGIELRRGAEHPVGEPRRSGGHVGQKRHLGGEHLAA